MTLFETYSNSSYFNYTKKWLFLNKPIVFLQAYANFGKRVKTLQSKLVEDKLPELKLDSKALLAAADISPIPSPDYDAPSPQSGELELVLPDEQQQQLQQQQQQLLLQQQQRSPVVDFNSRLDSMRSQMVQLKTFNRLIKQRNFKIKRIWLLPL